MATGSPRTVLLAWELGAGLGHARRLLAIALALKARGFTPIVAARELWACADDYRSAGISVLQAPNHRSQLPAGVAFRARGYADMMAISGYQRVEALWPSVLGWDALLDVVKPGVVVADYSPILALAAHGRAPMLAIGDGFVLPPPQLDRMPVLRTQGTELADEAVLLGNARQVQSRRGLPLPKTLPALIGGEAHVVSTFPECDIYAERRDTPASGPLARPGAPLPPAQERAIFAYLAADFRSTAKLLQVLAESGTRLETFVRDAPEQLKSALRGWGAHVHDTPQPLRDALARASLLVHHGGIGTIEECLALGRPQLLLPRHFEQTLNAARLDRLGTSMSLHASFSLADGRAKVAEALAADRIAARAQEVAASLAGRDAWRSLDTIVGHCETLSAA